MRTPRKEHAKMQARIKELYEQTDAGLPDDVRIMMVELKLKSEQNEKLKEAVDGRERTRRRQ